MTMKDIPGFVKPDTDKQVFFYEQDFYVLSNFSAFSILWTTGPTSSHRFQTSEHVYHWEKFNHPPAANIQECIKEATSAHEAFEIAQRNKIFQQPNWDNLKVGVMMRILKAKVEQHEYVSRKLLATGNRELIEDSWRDDFWGWGEDCNGRNELGKLWMRIRQELRDNTSAWQPSELVQHWINVSAKELEVIKEARAETQKARDAALDAPLPLYLRRATSSDLVEGTILWYPDRHARKWSMVVDVQYADDPWKAYTAQDGCRYGLEGAFVECHPLEVSRDE